MEIRDKDMILSFIQKTREGNYSEIGYKPLSDARSLEDQSQYTAEDEQYVYSVRN